MNRYIFYLILALSFVSSIPLASMQPNQRITKDDVSYTFYPNLPDNLPIDRDQWSYFYFLFNYQTQQVKRIIAKNHKGVVIGAISFGGIGKESCEIHHLEVVGEYQGRGIGRELLKMAIAQLFADDACKRVFWSSSDDAMGFYEKVGVQQDAARSDLFFVDADQQDSIK